ncbi:Ferroporti-1, partial [Tricladium varicosporioides]
SHFLSTWNVRTYQYQIIFTAAAYPDTLVASSVRGIVRTLASICFASSVGRWVDRAPNRLKTLSRTISVNRIAVIGASILWLFIVEPRQAQDGLSVPRNIEIEKSLMIKGTLFTLILVLGIFETLSASGNMLSMERDFVVTAADPDGQPYNLTHLNAVMRRIDLICKLVAPILVSVLISATNMKIGVLAVGGMSTVSWGVELWCAKRVWNMNPRLRVLKPALNAKDVPISSGARNPLTKVSQALQRYGKDFKNYFSSTVWIPSLALSFLHISVLAYNATFITFLLNVGFSLGLITVARAAGSLVEISSTLVTPVGVQYLSRAKNHGRSRAEDGLSEESGAPLLENPPEAQAAVETGLERLGLWGISWQLLNLVPVVLALWPLSPTSPIPNLLTRFLTPFPSHALLALTLFTFLSLSRLGLWIYDLTTQQLTQTLNPPSTLSSFTGVEYSFNSFFELLQNVITIVLWKPEQFKWIALLSLCAVGVSTVMYAGWVWWMRGHLVHWERLPGCGGKCGRGERGRFG